MRVILTGISGTLAPFVSEELSRKGHEVRYWKRGDVDLRNEEEILALMEREAPDYFIHLATGPEVWLENILKGLKRYDIPLIWTSSEAVFGKKQPGPFTEDQEPKPDDDYGKYKRRMEEMIMEKYPDKTHIIRLGWQIGEAPIKNNMLTYLMKEKKVHASTHWIPSTSFMADTANALVNLMDSGDYGIHHGDSNQENRSFYAIVRALRQKYNLPVDVIKEEEPKRNNRLISKNVLISSLKKRLRFE